MSIEVTSAGEDAAALVRVTGPVVDGASASELRKTLKELIQEGKVRTIVDLTEVSWFDSVAIGVLVSHYVSVTNRNGKVVILGANDRVKTLFALTRLLDRFDWVNDLASAVERVGTGSSDP